MSKFVFILGAGFSRPAGAPLMSEFLERSETLFRTNHGRGKYDSLFTALAELQRVHSKSDLDLYNLEAVFGAFEMGRTLNRLPAVKSEDIEGLISALKRMISETLERSTPFPVRARRPGFIPNYVSFGQVIQRLAPTVDDSLCSIITLNYDLIAEHTLLAAEVGYDYCVGDQDAGSMPLLKLHGSLNWGECSECQAIVPYHIQNYLGNYLGHDTPD